MNKDSLKQLQILEQSLHSIHSQKQQMQSQLIEIESALSEIDSSETAYKIVGNIMISSKKSDLKKDLNEKKEIFSSRVNVLDKEEHKMRTEAENLQKQLMKEMKE